MDGCALFRRSSSPVRIGRPAAILSRSQGRLSRTRRNYCSDRSGRPGIACHLCVTCRGLRCRKRGRGGWGRRWLGGFRGTMASGAGGLRSECALLHTRMAIAKMGCREPVHVGVIDVQRLLSPFGLAGVYADENGGHIPHFAGVVEECSLEPGQT